MEHSEKDVKTILVIEDEPAIRDICQRVLAREGYDVHFAFDCKEGQDMVRAKQYNVYLIDVRTPQMSGLEFYAWFSEVYPQITNRIIFTSGSLTVGGTISMIMDIGRPVLHKPFTPEELKSIIRKTLEEVENG